MRPLNDDPIFFDVRDDDEPRHDDGAGRPKNAAVWIAAAAALLGLVGGAIFLMDDDDERRRSVSTEQTQVTFNSEDPPRTATPAGGGRRAAACYESNPNAQTLRALFESVGGFEGLEVGAAEGAFDVVTFDPLDHDNLLAARRAGYLRDGNQDVNQHWAVSPGGVAQSTWDPATPHDFVHYNSDGSITMWVQDGDNDTFSTRRAVVLDQLGNRTPAVSSSAAIQADRFAVDGRTVFALTGDPDWYAPRDVGYTALVADDGARRVQLATGEDFGWIDVPTSGLLVAYPNDPSGVTAVWDTATLAPLDGHPLSGRPYQRVALASDAPTALAVTADGELEPLDLGTGRVGPRFGNVDVTEVERPLAISDDGTTAVSVDKSGTVSIWFVGGGTPVATFDASTALPRWLPTSRSAARVTSVVAPDASRVALRIPARPEVGVSWRLIDTDVDSWLARARALENGAAATFDTAVC